MSKSNVLAQIQKMRPDQFKQACQKIAVGLGFTRLDEASILGLGTQVVFLTTIERQSTDKMFLTKESWLLAFTRNGQSITEELETLVQSAETAAMQNILVVVFGSVDARDEERYHANAQGVELKSALLSGDFARILFQDYAANAGKPIESGPFSFAKLRERMKRQAQEAPWHDRFLPLTTLPIYVNKVQRKEALKVPGAAESYEDAALNEADLFGAIYKSSSFLLLGDPGAGKTTCLQKLAEELASVGARTPVFLPLNRYGGNLLSNLSEALCGNAALLSEQEVRSLLSSGALVVILDGVNEVQSQTLQTELVKEINALTDPEAPTARSHWIASSRRYDYSYALQLNHLDQHTWELLPLDSSLIYMFFTKELGEKEGLAVYSRLGANMREVCSNPLLLNMLLMVHKESGEFSPNRGVLYRQFVDLLLRAGAAKSHYQEELTTLAKFVGTPLTMDTYCLLACSVLSDLASEMQRKGTTAIGSGETLEVFQRHSSAPIALGSLPEEAVTSFYQGLLSRGILKFRDGKIGFFHHTFQEYFYAFKLRELPPDKLIPSTGIQGAEREALVFMASTFDAVDRLQELIEYVLSHAHDTYLAYEMLRSASIPIGEKIQLEVARSLWFNEVMGGFYVGAGKRPAQALVHIAGSLARSREQLLRDLLHPKDESYFTVQLLRLYQELGDVTSQQQLLKDIDFQDDTPDDLFFRVAITASTSGDYNKAIELYTECIKRHTSEAGSYGNRALAYEGISEREKAEKDYKQALSINPSSAVTRTNYARLLVEDKRESQAFEELNIALEHHQGYYDTYRLLGELLIAKDAHQACFYLEKAVSLAPDANRQTTCLKKLVVLQEKLGYFAGAMISLKHLIDLNPTSSLVKEWKATYAHLRLEYDKTQRHRMGSLASHARNVLHIAGWNIDYVGLQKMRAVSDKPGRVSPLSILVLDVPQLTDVLVRERVTELQNEEKEIKCLVLFTAAEIIDRKARIYLAQCQYPVALITLVELREALMQGERQSHSLLINAINRATQPGNPFKYMKLIQERSEFFGREQEKENFTSLILRHELVALYGIHKIGKSSFLRQVYQHLAVYAQHITPVWIEMSAALKNPTDLYRKILEGVYGKTKVFGPQALSAEQFQNELYLFWKSRQRDYANHQILLILDEYPYLFPGKAGEQGMTDYIEVLGLFKVLSQEGWFNLLPCGRTTALSRAARWPKGENPFIGMFQEQFLGPLSREEVEELIQVLGIKGGLDFSEEAIERIWVLAGGHPLFTRTLGGWIFDKEYKSSRRTSVSASAVDDAVKVFLRSGPEVALLRKIYREELEDEEQRIVKLLATSGRPLPRVALVPDNVSEDERKKIRVAVDNLLDTSVLKEAEPNRLSHRYELLRLVILQDMKEDDLYRKE